MKNFVDVNKEFITFVKKNLHEDPCRLRLRESGKAHPFDTGLAIDQIEARRKTKSKLPSFLEHEDFLFPDVLVAEQSTHESVARYNASVAGTGRLIVDMTAGLGIDAFAFASGGNRVIAVEMDKRRSRMLAHNTRALGLETRMRIVNADSLRLLPRMKGILCRGNGNGEKEPVLFLDPVRRGAGNSRTYFLEDCVPDVTECLPFLYSYATDILIKASPVLDIARAKSQLPGLREAHVVSVGGEVKEVLLCLRRGHTGEVMLKAVDLCATAGVNERHSFSLPMSETGDKEASVAADLAVMETGYLYDPMPALHKLHAGRSLCRRFKGLERVSQNTDLYVSRELYEDFPGRIFRMEGIVDGKELKALRRTGMAVISRNHPLSADMIRKKYGLAESDSSFLIAMRWGNKEEAVIVSGFRV